MRRILAALLAAAVLSVASTAIAAPFTVVNNGFSSYKIDGIDNPTLTLTRGQTYTFNIAATGHPFYIKTLQSTGTGNQYTTGVTGNGTQNGSLVWTVPLNAPATLFYDCSIHIDMAGQVNTVDAVPGQAPWSIALLVVLLGGLGVVFARRRGLLAWLGWMR